MPAQRCLVQRSSAILDIALAQRLRRAQFPKLATNFRERARILTHAEATVEVSTTYRASPVRVEVHPDQETEEGLKPNLDRLNRLKLFSRLNSH
jgi:hypothetical protein